MFHKLLIEDYKNNNIIGGVFRKTMVKYFAPRSLLTFSLLVWFILNFISPIVFEIKPTLREWSILIILICSFYAGSYCCSYLYKNYSKIETKVLPTRYSVIVRQAVIFIMLLSILGLLLRFYDFFIFKDFVSYNNISEWRLNYNENFNLISILSAPLLPLPVSLAIIAIYYSKQLPVWIKFVGYCLLLGLIIYIVLRGGRTTITLIFIMILTALAIAGYFNNINFNRKNILITIIFLVIFFIYSMQILSDRLEYMGFDYYSHIEYWEYSRNIMVDNDFLSDISKGNLKAQIYYALFSLIYYFQHGIYQFFYQCQHFDFNNITYGAVQFYDIAKLFKCFGIPTFSSDYIHNVLWINPGVYYSFWGPAIVDFGYFAPLYCFVLGFFAEYSWEGARQKKIFFMMIYPYIASVIFHSSFVNMINYGMGLYFFIALLLSGLILQYPPKSTLSSFKK